MHEFGKTVFDKGFLKAQLREWKEFFFSINAIICLIPGIVSISFLVAICSFILKDGIFGNIRLFSIGTIVVHASDLIMKSHLEVLAIVLMSLTSLVMIIVLAISFLCREIHFKGTQAGIYVAALLIVIWSIYWNRYILTELSEQPGKKLVIAMTVVLQLSYNAAY